MPLRNNHHFETTMKFSALAGVTYLELVVGVDHLDLDPSRVAGCRDWSLFGLHAAAVNKAPTTASRFVSEVASTVVPNVVVAPPAIAPAVSGCTVPSSQSSASSTVAPSSATDASTAVVTDSLPSCSHASPCRPVDKWALLGFRRKQAVQANTISSSTTFTATVEPVTTNTEVAAIEEGDPAVADTERVAYDTTDNDPLIGYFTDFSAPMGCCINI